MNYIGYHCVTIFINVIQYVFGVVNALWTGLFFEAGTRVFAKKVGRGIILLSVCFLEGFGDNFTGLKLVKIGVGQGLLNFVNKMVIGGGLWELWCARYAINIFIWVVAGTELWGNVIGGAMDLEGASFICRVACHLYEVTSAARATGYNRSKIVPT